MDNLDFVSKDLAFKQQKPLSPAEVDLVRSWEAQGHVLAGLTKMVMAARSRPITRPTASARKARVGDISLTDWEAEALAKAIGHMLVSGSLPVVHARRLLEKLEAVKDRRAV